MPKKRRQAPDIKPRPAVHPSLLSASSSRNRHGAQTRNGVCPSSVTDLLHHLRATQHRRPEDDEHSLPQADIRPSITTMSRILPMRLAELEIEDTPQSRMAERRRMRGPAGPAPPRSWAIRSIHASLGMMNGPRDKVRITDEFRPRFCRLPGLIDAEYDPRTVSNQSMRVVAKHWSECIEGYKDYPSWSSKLCIRSKQVLVAHLAFENPGEVSLESLRVLFTNEADTEAATDTENVTHLDFSGVIGRTSESLDWEQFLRLIRYRPFTSTLRGRVSVPDSWDSDDENDNKEDEDSEAEITLGNSHIYDFNIPMGTQPAARARFESLTHLSLACTPSPSWTGLLAAASWMPCLTHLSLAQWPVPGAHNTTLPTNFRVYPTGRSMTYQEVTKDFSEVARSRRLRMDSCNDLSRHYKFGSSWRCGSSPKGDTPSDG
jgi:hypothetical protein